MVIVVTPTPDPSPQGGGERSYRAAAGKETPMKPADVCIAVLVAVIWGFAFVASRIALDEIVADAAHRAAVYDWGFAMPVCSRGRNCHGQL